MNYEYPWEEFDVDIDTLVESIFPLVTAHRIACVAGIPRSGLIPAVALSHRLDLPYVNLPSPEEARDSRCLIVDDMTRTGNTLNPYVATDCFTAVLFHHPDALARPSFFTNVTRNYDGVDFPWSRT